MALLLVLTALALLTVMLTELQDEAADEFASATAERDALQAEYAARSAINLGRLLIAAEPTIRSSLGLLLTLGGQFEASQLPIWEYASELLGAFNDAAGQQSFTALSGIDLSQGKNLGLSGASFELLIVDEDSKINVNLPARGGVAYQKQLAEQLMGLLAPPQYDPLFENRDPDGNFSDRQTICSALIDWTDPDTTSFSCDLQSYTAQEEAPEDSYYELLRPAYHRKNAAFDSLEELHLVRGFSDDFWATFVDPDPDDPRKRLLTVWAQDRLNLNTVHPQVLISLVCQYATPETSPCNDPEQMANLVGLLGAARQLLPGIPLLGSPKNFVRLVTGKSKSQLAQLLFQLLPDFKPIVFLSEEQFIKNFVRESKVFSFYATGKVRSGRRETRVRIHAVVDYRNAPPPGMARNPADLLAASTELGTAAVGSRSAGTGGSAELPEGATEDAYASVLVPSPAGNVIYYRID